MQLFFEHLMMKILVEKLTAQHKLILQIKEKQAIHEQKKYII